jgi:predicted nucleotidyltransferase
LLAPARRFAEDLDPALAVQAVVVFGSVARRDCHDHSDVDVLVVAHNCPSEPWTASSHRARPERVEVVA